MKEDSRKLIELMRKVTGEEPKLWGGKIVGFGSFNYASNRSKCAGDWMLAGFTPGKTGLSLSFMCGFKHKKMTSLLSKLGPHSISVSCLKPKLRKGQSAAQVWDWSVLEKMIEFSLAELRAGRFLGSG